MADATGEGRRDRKGVAVMLAWIAGFVDGVGYLVLMKMFTSHMSGNTIAGAVHLGDEKWGSALHRLFPIPVFVAGVACGRILITLLSRRGVRSVFAIAFAIEALFLGLFIGCGIALFRDGVISPDSPVVFYLVAAIPPVAMGLQNATLRRAGGTTIRTSYITGALTDFTEEVVDYISWRLDGSPPESDKKQPSLTRAAMLLAIWFGYLAGAGIGALAEQHWHLTCLFIPIGFLVLLSLLDLASPFARPVERALSSP